MKRQASGTSRTAVMRSGSRIDPAMPMPSARAASHSVQSRPTTNIPHRAWSAAEAVPVRSSGRRIPPNGPRLAQPFELERRIVVPARPNSAQRSALQAPNSASTAWRRPDRRPARTARAAEATDGASKRSRSAFPTCRPAADQGENGERRGAREKITKPGPDAASKSGFGSGSDGGSGSDVPRWAGAWILWAVVRARQGSSPTAYP